MRSDGCVPARDELRDKATIQLTDETLVDGMAGFRWQLRAILAEGARHLVVDVKRVRRMSSAVIRALLGAHRVCRARGGGVVLRNPNRKTVDLLLRHGLHHVFTVEGANARLTRREYAVPPLRARRLGAKAVERQRRWSRNIH
jgi:anti-sigma B factor antagonist